MKKKILVVDDDCGTRDAVVMVLEAAGFLTEYAEDGRVALEKIRAFGPDLVLLDMVMPVMGGREFRAVQVKDPSIASIPTVVVSARSAHEVADLGADGFVGKPFDAETLVGAVRARLG
jgi:CheY-like chemotaxis protein